MLFGANLALLAFVQSESIEAFSDPEALYNLIDI